MKMKWIELLNKIANNEIEEGTRFRISVRSINLEWEGMISEYMPNYNELNDEVEIIDTKEV